jgi:ABC-2 type transport system ATP-binding protein
VSELLSVSALAKRYGGARARTSHPALTDVSFRLCDGELVALVGPNGAGKTTLLSILAGLQAPTAGTVSRPPGAGERAPGWRVGWVPQAPALYSKLSVAENLELFARLERAPRPRELVGEMLEQAGLSERAAEPVAHLSGGNRQRVNIAIGLLGDPPVLALDEPSSSLDPGQRERLWQFVLARVAAGTTVLFSTHNVSEAQRYAGRVLVLDGGRLLFDGETAALLRAGGEDAGGDLERALVRFLRERPGDPGQAAAAPEGWGR